MTVQPYGLVPCAHAFAIRESWVDEHLESQLLRLSAVTHNGEDRTTTCSANNNHPNFERKHHHPRFFFIKGSKT